MLNNIKLKDLRIREFLSDGLFAIAAISIVAMIILPVPIWILDILLALNLGCSLLTLMACLFAKEVMSLSTFPTLLLFTTMFRLGLNIASSKLILLTADAGQLIESFGELVVAGNVVVGIVIFIIITFVQFIVITKGSERVAEVGARFTLDAMPGKQMAIDADLRAGSITAEQAGRLRNILTAESKLHGGMDGAMKFVKGDAIAGIFITAINLFAGIAVGIIYHEMTASQAVHKFAILSIGDAMVASIPSLLVSLAAGILITRVDSSDSKNGVYTLGREIFSQLTENSSVLWFSSLIVCGMGLIPGFPHVQFFIVGAGLAWLAIRSELLKRAGVESFSPDGGDQHRSANPKFALYPPKNSAAIGIRLSLKFANKINPVALDKEFIAINLSIDSRVGIPVTPFAVWQDATVTGNSFEVLVFDVPFLKVDIPEGYRWLINPENSPSADVKILEVAALHRTFVWCAHNDSVATEELGSLEKFCGEMCLGAVLKDPSKFVGMHEVSNLFDSFSKRFPGVVSEIQKAVTLQRCTDIFKMLLEERIPIRNLRSIMEAMAKWGAREKDTQNLYGLVRQELGPWLANRAKGSFEKVPGIIFSDDFENYLIQHLKPIGSGVALMLSPEDEARLKLKIEETLKRFDMPVALVTPFELRLPIFKYFYYIVPVLDVYSYQELMGHCKLNILATIDLSD